MKIPADAIIPREKLTDYLLVPKARNDKSGFLAQAGFTSDNPDALTVWLERLHNGEFRFITLKPARSAKS